MPDQPTDDAATRVAEAAQAASTPASAPQVTTTPDEGHSEAHSTPGGDNHGGDQQVPALRREAAERRRQLREVEAERDQLRGELDGLHRAEVERTVANRFAEPSDLWAIGVQLEDLRGEGGALDQEKVKATADRVLAARPHWAKPVPDFDAGVRQPIVEQPGFGAAIKRAVSGGRD